MLPDAPPREVIEQLLAAAVTAPNHYLTQPWRFAVIAGDARHEVGAVMEATLRKRMAGEDQTKVEGQAMGERNKLLRAPVVIAVAVKREEATAHIPAFEDMAATAASVQNILLAAHGLGLGAYWRSGNSVFEDDLKSHLGFNDSDELVAFVYVGYPDPNGPDRPVRPRESFQSRTVWLGYN
jgi:nitroreductase